MTTTHTAADLAAAPRPGGGGSRWRLAELMAAQGLRHSTDLIPLLKQRGITLSRPQVYRIVFQRPERLSVSLIAALCDILGCSSDDLLDLPTPAAPATTQTGSGQPTARTADTPVDGTDARGTDVRQRLLTAMADCIDDLGYPQTTVAHVVARARASRRTFYQVFTDREDCFIALLTQANHDIIAAITDAVDPTAFWQIQVRQAIEAWVASAQSRPALMLAWIRDVPTLAASTRRLQNEAMEAFIVMLQTLSNTGELRAHGITPVSRQRAIMIIGGLRELTAMTVESGGHLADITDEAVAACIALGPTPDTSD